MLPEFYKSFLNVGKTLPENRILPKIFSRKTSDL